MQRLRDKMREDLALRGMSAGTIVTYVGCARRFAEHFGRSPSRMGAAEVREFLLHLAGRVRPNTFNGYVSALRFLYGVTLARPEDGATLPLRHALLRGSSPLPRTTRRDRARSHGQMERRQSEIAPRWAPALRAPTSPRNC